MANNFGALSTETVTIRFAFLIAAVSPHFSVYMRASQNCRLFAVQLIRKEAHIVTFTNTISYSITQPDSDYLCLR